MRILCIHHSAVQSDRPQFLSVQSYHDRGADGKWPRGHGIQYTFFGEVDGTLHRPHDINKITWHAGSTEWNEKSIGYCFAGDFTKHMPTPEQLATLYQVWKELQYPPIVYHKEIRPGPTSCPGSFPFRENLEGQRIADLARQKAAAEKALPRFIGTMRGNLLVRFIERAGKTIKLYFS